MPATAKEELYKSMAMQAGHYVTHATIEEFRVLAKKAMNGHSTFHWALEFPEVIVERGGFDAIVGNPPFLGGGRISTIMGDALLRFLLGTHPHAFRSVDLCAYFFLRAYELSQPKGSFGLISTNTIAQGDTKKAGLQWLLERRVVIRHAQHINWPGMAAVEVVVLVCSHSSWSGKLWLDGESVTNIAADLTTLHLGDPNRLNANSIICFEGSKIHGEGFILHAEEAMAIIQKSPKETLVIKPFLSGIDITSHPNLSATRFVICFQGMSRDQAENFPLSFAIVVKRVKPHRDTIKSQYHGERFWRYWTERPELYERLESLDYAIVASRVAKYLSFVFTKTGVVFSDSLVVFPTEKAGLLAILQSNIHTEWAFVNGSTLETRFRYTYSTCFETFPLPSSDAITKLDGQGRAYSDFRGKVMASEQVGVTQLYNRFHNSEETADNIRKLRDLHAEMDYAVATAYGWTDLDLSHGFHETKQGVRFTTSESAQHEFLARLLQLNHERYEEEVRQGLHDRKKVTQSSTKRGRRNSPSSNALPLFGLSDAANEPEEVLTND